LASSRLEMPVRSKSCRSVLQSVVALSSQWGVIGQGNRARPHCALPARVGPYQVILIPPVALTPSTSSPNR
jgi:hypothetical protein